MVRRTLAVLAIALLAATCATMLYAAQRAQDTTTTSEPWECTQCKLCKENSKKVCGDSKTCTSNCAQLCIVCSQKSLTGNGATTGGQHPKLEGTP